MAGLSKSRVQAHLQCPRRLWLQTFKPELAEESASTTMRLKSGTHVGEVARDLYPDGVLIEGDTLAQSLRDTEALLGEKKPRPLFEATFEYEGVLVRVDLLLPVGKRYRLVEVKSSTSVKDYHLSDVAVQYWVLVNSGVSLETAELAHIDNQFVYQGNEDYQGLFQHADLTGHVEPLMGEVMEWVRAAKETLLGNEPLMEPGNQCTEPFECPFFAYCAPPAPEGEHYPPEDLPRAGALAEQLRYEGYVDLREVPPGRLVNARHQRIHEVILSGEAWLDPGAREELGRLPYPRYYLDFETIQFAVPIWTGTRPYQQIPFQWSCHIETGSGVLSHREFLVDGAADPRREFAESLLEALGSEGPIIVYNAGFERSRMRELGQAFPDLQGQLEAAIDRIFDLLPLARDYYYHPAMHGSWSIKVVLPTIAPELDYSQMSVADGGMAQEAYMRMYHGEMAESGRTTLRAALLAYCERDTLAMVRIAHAFEGIRPNAG